jgi:ribosome modulation factor
LYRVLKPPTTLILATTQGGEPAGIAGRRRPTIPYQAFNLTQTTKLNPKTG